MMINLLLQNPMLFLVWVLAIVFALTIHEFFHAFTGYLLGDKTAARAGRLTLNPMAHIDPIGFFALMFVGIGWAKPVPFNPYNLKFKKWGPALVALAGPGSNLASFIVLGIFTMFVNAILLFFNILPIPPLDGSKILFAYLASPKYNNLKVFLQTRGPLLLLGLLLLNWATNGIVLSPLFIATFYMFKLIGLSEALVTLFSLF